MNTTGKYPSFVRSAAVELLHTFYGIWRKQVQLAKLIRSGMNTDEAIRSMSSNNGDCIVAQDSQASDEFDDEFDDAFLMEVDFSDITKPVTTVSSESYKYAGQLETQTKRFAEDMQHVTSFLSGLIQARFKSIGQTSDPSHSQDHYYSVDHGLLLLVIDTIVDATIAYVYRQRSSTDAAWKGMMETYGPKAFWATAGSRRFHLDNRMRNLRFLQGILEYDLSLASLFPETVIQVWFEAFVDQWLSTTGCYSGVFEETFDRYSQLLFSSNSRLDLFKGLSYPIVATGGSREILSPCLLDGKSFSI